MFILLTRLDWSHQKESTSLSPAWTVIHIVGDNGTRPLLLNDHDFENRL
jgi:hypothetical protein